MGRIHLGHSSNGHCKSGAERVWEPEVVDNEKEAHHLDTLGQLDVNTNNSCDSVPKIYANPNQNK